MALSPKRKGRITGSAVGAILGLDPNTTPAQAMRRMVREYHGATAEFQGNVATEWGNSHEALAKMDYLGKTGNLIEECGFFIHPEHDWLGATPDGLIGLDGLAEIKCPFGIRNDSPPKFKTAAEQPHYFAQMQIEMHCAGREWVHFYQWTRHGDALETVRTSEAWWDGNFHKLEAFYHQFLGEINNPAHLEPLRREIEDDKARVLVAEYDQCQAQIDNATARKKEILNELVAIAGEKDADICGRKLTRIERKGAVQYGKIPELEGVDLEQWRKAPSSFWKFS